MPLHERSASAARATRCARVPCPAENIKRQTANQVYDPIATRHAVDGKHQDFRGRGTSGIGVSELPDIAFSEQIDARKDLLRASSEQSMPIHKTCRELRPRVRGWHRMWCCPSRYCVGRDKKIEQSGSTAAWPGAKQVSHEIMG